MPRWTIYKWRCRFDYRDGCHPTWMAVPPDSDCLSLEFDTWKEAIAYVNCQIRS